MMEFDAWHLPGFRGDRPLRSLVATDEVVIRHPLLTEADLRDQCRRLLHARSKLRERTTTETVASLAASAGRLQQGPLREQALALLPFTTGYSAAMAERVLDRMAADWRRDALLELVRVDLGSADALDDYSERPGENRAVLAVGPALTFNVFSGNVPGVAVTALVRCLLVGSAVLGKTASGEPVLPVLFARALAEVDPPLADALALSYWPGAEKGLRAAALEQADAVVVYGGSDAVETFRMEAPPGTRVVSHGPRVSAAFVAREALADAAQARRIAADLAGAVSLFDQQGCVSPHVAFVEKDGAVTPEEFASLLEVAMDDLADSLPRGRLRSDEVAAFRREAEAAEFRALAGSGSRLLGSPGRDFAIAFQDEGDFVPSCLNRFLHLSAVQNLETAIRRLDRLRAVVQTAGLAARPPRRQPLARLLAAAGFSRVTSLREMPWPPPTWHHDGAGPLRELIRWVDLESD